MASELCQTETVKNFQLVNRWKPLKEKRQRKCADVARSCGDNESAVYSVKMKISHFGVFVGPHPIAVMTTGYDKCLLIHLAVSFYIGLLLFHIFP